ncbi:MAG TPA: ATPase [Porphyromonadaceae bacterium]|nr:ATPase [Porphyromonadaceae bacterium]
MKKRTLDKQGIVSRLREYCAKYDSQNKAAASLKGVSSATVSQMVNGNWELIKDEMWRNVAAQIGYTAEQWSVVKTRNFSELMFIYGDAQENSLVLAVIGDAGSGKTFAARYFQETNRRAYLLCCNEYWNRKLFLAELLTVMGKDYSGYTVGEMMHEVVSGLKKQETPLLILDEADKLSDQVLFFFITLYNQLEDECGIVLQATNHLEKRLKRGIKLNKKGYNEIWSRVGRKCVKLSGVSAEDIASVCAANGVNDTKTVDRIIDDSESDLRRVKRRIHASKKSA